MAHDGQDLSLGSVILPDLLTLTGESIAPIEGILETARTHVQGMVMADGRVSGALVEQNQFAAHGLAWLATYVESLRQMQAWATRLEAEGTFGEVEQLIHQIAFGEYLSQIHGGIQMNQGEIVRLADMGLSQDERRAMLTETVEHLMQHGNNPGARTRLVHLMEERQAEVTHGRTGLDEELEMIRDQFRRYAVERVEPHAHEWHLKDELIPMEVIEELAEMGVFGLTIPEEYGGLGLSKASMCVVSEELSRGYIGVGSLGTRSEIAAELVIAGGTQEQKEKWLPRFASGETLPTAVFTEPNTGSDLGSLRTRAVKDEKTFESARIQTAARAIGVAQAALDVGMQYAIDRKQFGKSLINFPRVSGKLAMMAVEIMIARQLTYFSAFEKDQGRRCDVEAGMAKLLGARVAWACADNALQIHGGNGFALEYKISRILCDARILNIFEGAAEIQAQVIARRLLA